MTTHHLTTAPLAAHLPAPGRLRLTVAGALSNLMVDQIQAIITSAPADARDVVLEAGGLTDLDPVAAARLWLFCDRSGQARRRRVRIEALPPALARRLHRHPLRAYLGADEAIFSDPFAVPAASER